MKKNLRLVKVFSMGEVIEPNLYERLQVLDLKMFYNMVVIDICCYIMKYHAIIKTHLYPSNNDCLNICIYTKTYY